MVGLKSLKELNISILFLSSNCKVAGEMKIPTVKIEFDGDSIFAKPRVLPYGLREAVRKTLDSLVSSGFSETVT